MESTSFTLPEEISLTAASNKITLGCLCKIPKIKKAYIDNQINYLETINLPGPGPSENYPEDNSSFKQLTV
jgi:hypothetical protein